MSPQHEMWRDERLKTKKTNGLLWQVHRGKDEDIQWVEANPTDYLIAETCAAKLFIA